MACWPGRVLVVRTRFAVRSLPGPGPANAVRSTCKLDLDRTCEVRTWVGPGSGGPDPDLGQCRSNYEPHEGPQQPTTANAGQRRPTAANEGQCRPTKTRYVSFSNVHFIFYFLITTK